MAQTMTTRNGLPIEHFVEEVQTSLADGQLPIAVYANEDVYRAELDYIFGRSWAFVGHETEIPQPGDYAVRWIGEDPFILVRGEDGEVRVLFDSCRHRGTTVCVAERGNTSHFRCPYHGWLYKNTGALVGMPSRRVAYKTLDATKWGLVAAPRVSTYRGLVFASLAPEGPSLEDHLGEFRWYLDMHLGLTPQGMRVVGDPHRWRVDADWKFGVENGAGDSYHTNSLHRSAVEIGLYGTAQAGAAGARGSADVHVADCDGHTTSIRAAEPGVSAYFGYPKDIVQAIENNGLSEAQQSILRNSVVHTGYVFPNLTFIHIMGTNDPKYPPVGWLGLRIWQPVGVGQMEVWSWVLLPKESSAEYVRRATTVATGVLGPSGNVEADDLAVWTSISRPARSRFAINNGLTLNYQMGLPGMSQAALREDWPGPGLVYDTNLEEGIQRTFHRTWCSAILQGVRATKV